VGRRDGWRPTLLPKGDGAQVRGVVGVKRQERKKARVFLTVFLDAYFLIYMFD
jgi:hypothetical protein